MHKILVAAMQHNEVISDSSLYALFKSYAGEDNAAELRQSIDDGASLRLAPNALGPCATLKMTARRKYFLFGEKFEIPQYELKQPADSTCVAWFGGRDKKQVEINGDQIKAVSWLNENNEGRNGEKIHQPISVFFAMKRVDHLPVFQHCRSRHTCKEISSHQTLKYGMIRTGSGK